MPRPFNFSAGPATLPLEVLQQAADEMLDWQGCGMSVMEMSHRGPEFGSILEQALADIRELLSVPPAFHILFMQGGGLAENAIVPLNLLHPNTPAQVMNFVVTGAWSNKSFKEASRYGSAHLAAKIPSGTHPIGIPPPSEWNLTPKPAYVHICSNETINGIEFHDLPDLQSLGCNAPLVIDFSSNLASRTIDWTRVGLAYGGAQKNVGIAGLTLVFVHESLLADALPICPSAFNFKIVADHQSMYNTPPTYSIYIAGLVFQWLQRQTHGDLKGLAAIEARNIQKAQWLYDYIDTSDLYENKVDVKCRSRMNVPFHLRNSSLHDAFLAEANHADLLQLKGHQSVGGMRASLYNAMLPEGVRALINFMQDFEKRHG
ncbi:MAG: 3-phosphoserine/phosphohydroxythreonine transaminase [Burkholderiales bacterium]